MKIYVHSLPSWMTLLFHFININKVVGEKKLLERGTSSPSIFRALTLTVEHINPNYTETYTSFTYLSKYIYIHIR